MYNRRIIINEDDRSRILNMHENHAKRNNLNFGRLRLNEAAAQPTDVAAFQDYMDTVSQTWNNGGTLNKGAGYGNFGPNTQTAWGTYGDQYEQSKANKAKTFQVGDRSGTNLSTMTLDQIANAVKTGEITTASYFNDNGQMKPVIDSPEIKAELDKVAQPVAAKANLSQYSFNVGGKAVKYNTEEDLKSAVENKQVNTNTQVYSQKLGAWTPISSQSENVDFDIVFNPQKYGIIPDIATQQVKSTGNQAVDTWLQTPEGVYFKTLTNDKAKEQFMDYLEKTGAGIIAQAGGKKALRQAALGAISADTGIGRLGQRIKQGVQGAVQGFQGQQQA
jgi:hypothetical protein